MRRDPEDPHERNDLLNDSTIAWWINKEFYSLGSLHLQDKHTNSARHLRSDHHPPTELPREDTKHSFHCELVKGLARIPSHPI